MNNVKIDENSLLKTTEKLIQSLIELNCQEKLRKSFTINKSNVFLLPNAFKKSENDTFIAYEPSDQFAKHVDDLRKRILNFIQMSKKN
jgi:hypothetical protein